MKAGHGGDPLYGARRILRTRLPLLSSRQQSRLTAVFADDAHLSVVLTWSVYQRVIAAYADTNRRRGKQAMTRLINSIRRGVPAGLEEIAQLAAASTSELITRPCSVRYDHSHAVARMLS